MPVYPGGDVPGTKGAYKSLTGPGEGATPGDLTQEGGFTVNDVADGINLNSTDNFVTVDAFGVLIEGTTDGVEITGDGIQIISTQSLQETITENIDIDIANGGYDLKNAGTGDINIENNGGGTIRLGPNVSDPLASPALSVGVDTGVYIGFLGAEPIARQIVAGSRGGNAALASLLTALTTFGLITDDTTP